MSRRSACSAAAANAVPIPADPFQHTTVTDTFFQTVWLALAEGSTKEFEWQGPDHTVQLRGDDVYCNSCERVVGLGSLPRPYMCRKCASLYCHQCMASPARCRRDAKDSSSSKDSDLSETPEDTQRFKSKCGVSIRDPLGHPPPPCAVWEMVKEATVCLNDLKVLAVSAEFDIASGEGKYDAAWEAKLMTKLRHQQRRAFYKYMKIQNVVYNDPNLRPHMAQIEEQISLIGWMNMQLAIKVKGVECLRLCSAPDTKPIIEILRGFGRCHRLNQAGDGPGSPPLPQDPFALQRIFRRWASVIWFPGTLDTSESELELP